MTGDYARRIRPHMTDSTRLTEPQKTALTRIIDSLHDKGFDPDRQLLDSPNLHCDNQSTGRVDWWMDGDRGFANGSMDRDGHGLWWLRRTYPPMLHTI